MIIQQKISNFSKFVNASKVLEVLTTIENNGFEAFIAGGAVRDMLLGRTPKDFDIATNAKPKDIKRLFPNHRTTGERFGTIAVILRDEIPQDDDKPELNFKDVATVPDIFEITTYRSESVYSDLRHPDAVNFSDNLFEDSARRDFTINSIYADKNGYLHDPQNGNDDLKAKVIRCVGNPDQRFNEDGLRVLRAFRFSSQLGFYMENATQKSAIENWSNLLRVSKERFYEEFKKMVLGDHYYSLIPVLLENDLLDFFVNFDGIVCQNLNLKYVNANYGKEPSLLLKRIEYLQKRLQFYGSSKCKFENFLLDLSLSQANQIRFEYYLKQWIDVLPLRKEERRKTEEGMHFCRVLIKNGPTLTVGHILRLGLNVWSLADLKLFATKELFTALNMDSRFTQEFIYALDHMTHEPKPLVKAKDLIQSGIKVGPDLKRLESLAFERQLENPEWNFEQLLRSATSAR